ncbi:MAG: beta-galactosidase, partial [Verrucomicrobiae bacterium]|nr:beta-galactosidase [Verrucomicrobiae bacterium]
MTLIACFLVLPLEAREVISLAGKWRFQLDAGRVGVKQEWSKRELNEMISLPGTTDEAKKGMRNTERVDDRLSRPWRWVGAAWYQREVEIPPRWQGKRITLTLERTKDVRVWVDGQYCGWNDLLSAPQVYDLTRVMKPGKRQLTICVDNSRVPPTGPSHAIDERTQTNWNGIVGRIELQATEPVWIEDVQVYPDVEKRQATVRVVVGNITGQAASGELLLRAESTNVKQTQQYAAVRVPLITTGERTVAEHVWKPEQPVPLWNEFEPALIAMGVGMTATAGNDKHVDVAIRRFGMREFSRDRNLLLLNNKRVFLRGRIDCCFYPLTGYPPMDAEGWRKVLGQLKDWGLNHVRFHTWTPPAAAFEAADELGFYFQVELPNKRSAFVAGGQDDPNAAKHNIDYLAGEDGDTKVTLYDYALRDSEAVMRCYGNSPSFAMYTLGNELGRRPAM